MRVKGLVVHRGEMNGVNPDPLKDVTRPVCIGSIETSWQYSQSTE